MVHDQLRAELYLASVLHLLTVKFPCIRLFRYFSVHYSHYIGTTQHSLSFY